MIPFPSMMFNSAAVGAICHWQTFFGNNAGGNDPYGQDYLLAGISTNSLGNGSAIANVGKHSGKYYFESGGGPYFYTGGIGISPVANTVSPFTYGASGYGCQLSSDGTITDADTFGSIYSYTPSWSGGSTPSTPWVSGSWPVVQVAVDLTNNLIWFGVNGTWVGNPTAGTGGQSIIHTTYYPVGYAAATGNSAYTASLRGRFNTSQFVYSPPTGFAQWR